jgi:hypothetical protein
MKKPKQTKLTPKYFTPTKEKTENNPKVSIGFRCPMTTQQEILRLAKKAEITMSEWVSHVIENAVKNKVEVKKVVSIKYNNQ